MRDLNSSEVRLEEARWTLLRTGILSFHLFSSSVASSKEFLLVASTGSDNASVAGPAAGAAGDGWEGSRIDGFDRRSNHSGGTTPLAIEMRRGDCTC